MRARFFGPEASTRARQRARSRPSVDAFRIVDLDIRDADGVERVVRAPRAGRSSSSCTPPRSRRTTGRRRTRTPTSRSTPTARSTCWRPRASTRPTRPSSSPRRTRSTATARTSCRSSELETRLELPEDHRWYRRASTRRCPIDHSHALAVRRLEGRGRSAGAGVRALLRHADRLLPRRLPDRPAARRRAAARLPRVPDEVHRHRRAVHGLRLRRQAGARQHPRATTSCSALRGVPRAPRARPPSTTSAAGGRATSRCSRRSSCARRSPGESSTGRSPRGARSGDHRWWISDLDEFERDYPDWRVTVRHRGHPAGDPRPNVERVDRGSA